jgi:hypothetical protein
VVPTGLTTNPPATTGYFFVEQHIAGVNASVILSSSGTSAFTATVVNALSLVFGEVEITKALTSDQSVPYSTNVTYTVSYTIGTSIFDVYLVLRSHLITAVSSGTFTIDLHDQAIVYKVSELLNATAKLQPSFSQPFVESPTFAPTHALKSAAQSIATTSSPSRLATESASPTVTALRNGHAAHTANDQIPTYRPTRYHIIVHRPTGTPSTGSPSWFPFFMAPFWKPSFEPSLSPEDAPSSTPTVILH